MGFFTSHEWLMFLIFLYGIKYSEYTVPSIDPSGKVLVWEVVDLVVTQSPSKVVGCGDAQQISTVN